MRFYLLPQWTKRQAWIVTPLALALTILCFVGTHSEWVKRRDAQSGGPIGEGILYVMGAVCLLWMAVGLFGCYLRSRRPRARLTHWWFRPRSW
jgi:hypothetical protein